MLKKANSLGKRLRHRSKRKKNDEAKDECSKSSSFKEESRDSVRINGEREDYEEKLRIMREELTAKYNEQMDGMKKRESSNMLRMNTKLTCIARQRDEMETKLHLVEKKYENAKKQISSRVPSGNSAFMAKDDRSVNDVIPRTGESIAEAKRAENPIWKAVGKESDLESVEARLKDIYGVVNVMRAEMNEIRDMILVTSKNIEKLSSVYGSDVMKMTVDDGSRRNKSDVRNNETELQRKRSIFKDPAVESEEVGEGASIILMQDEITDERVDSKITQLSEGLLNCSTEMDEQLGMSKNPENDETDDTVKGTTLFQKENCDESNKNGPKSSLKYKSQNQKTIGSYSEAGKTNLDIYSRKKDAEQTGYKVIPAELRGNLNLTLRDSFSGMASTKEDSASEWDIEGEYRFDGTPIQSDVGVSVPHNAQQNDDFSSCWTKDDVGLLKTTEVIAEKHECPKERKSSVNGGNVEGEMGPDMCCFVCKFDQVSTRDQLNCRISDTDNPPPYKIQYGCVGKCCRCCKEITCKQRIEQCPRCMLEHSKRWITAESCPTHPEREWCQNGFRDAFWAKRCCKSVGHNERFAGRDYVQRHVVKSSAIIANLRDLKPDEEWM